MGDRDTMAGAHDSEAEITLGLLNAIHGNSATTQRSLARELGIALGLANAYLKRCVKKGLIKVSQVPPNRYAYYLTPQGFAEKSRLTAQYLSASFTFFRRARAQCRDLFGECVGRGWRRVALAGTGELGEIATLCARDFEVSLVGFVDRRRGAAGGGRFAGLPVVAALADLGPVDAVIVTELETPQEAFAEMSAQLPPGRVLAPLLLHVVAGGSGAEGTGP